MAKLSVLIIGCGSIGERHLRCFQKTDRARVTACDANPALLQRMASTYRVATTSDWKSAIEEGGFDAVVIGTPAQWHIPMGLHALKAGKHVLIEKPLSHSLSGVDELLAIRHDRQAVVGYVHRVHPFLIEARNFLIKGELGPIQQVVVTCGQPFHRLRPGYAQTYYRDHAMGGGAIQDALTHFANWVESVIGPTDSVLCDCAHLVVPDVEVEDTVHLSARHGERMVGYTLNQFQAPNESTVQFNAAQGSLKVEYHHRRWGVFREGDTAWTWHDNAAASDRDAPFIAQARAFLDQIEGKPAQLCSLEAAAQTLRFNLAALASAKSGARVLCRDLQN